MKTKIGIAVALILLIAAGWLLMQKNTVEIPPATQTLRVGLSFDSIVVERWKRDMETFVAAANRQGIEVDVQIANDDLNEQKKQIQYLIDEDVQVLVILPKQKDAYTELIARAKRKGIHVVAYDRLILNADYDAYISFDSVGVGEQIAGRLVRQLELDGIRSPKLMIINGDPEDNNSKLFNEGFYNILDSVGKDMPIEIVAEEWAPGWREAVAFDAVEKLLDSGVVPDGIIAANDVLATAAIQALTERRLAGKVLVVSEDAELSACQRIVEGTQLATVYKPYNTMAQRAVTMCLELIQGTFKADGTIANGSNQIPLVEIPAELVDKTTIDKIIIDSGFHSRDDVYRNVKQ